tara:strand:+ start:3042 stop:4166 length:1125 start_codon:yes stop_codon:yes gene_type:complete
MNDNLSKRISHLQQFSIEELSITQLINIREQIDRRISNLDNELSEIERSVGMLKAGVFDKEHTLPNKFSSPLRMVLARGWDLNRIERLHDRYSEESERIEKLINQKKLEDKQIEIFKSSRLYKIKQTFIAFLIVFVLGLMLFEFNNDLTESFIIKLFIVDTICCIVFLSNFFFELRLSDDKKWYWKTHWIDFITSIPLPPGNIIRAGRGFRLLRFARLFRIIRILRFLRVVRVFTQYWRGMEPLADLLDIKLMKRTLLWSAILTIICSFMIYKFENPHTNFNNWYEGLWWGVTTILTGGFTDLHNPSTLIGYLATIILVISGMILIGVFVASLSSVIEANSDDVVGSVKNFIDQRFNDIDIKINEISDRIDSQN